MRSTYTLGLFTQSLLYIAGGINHLWHPATYVRIMPPHYTHPLGLVQVSGIAEILGGICLLVPATRKLSALGLIAMLVVYFDVHLYMAAYPGRFAPIPPWLIYARVPLQFVLIGWAALYARRPADRASGPGAIGLR